MGNVPCFRRCRVMTGNGSLIYALPTRSNGHTRAKNSFLWVPSSVNATSGTTNILYHGICSKNPSTAEYID